MTEKNAKHLEDTIKKISKNIADNNPQVDAGDNLFQICTKASLQVSKLKAFLLLVIGRCDL
jgi:hypothetical protein